MSTHIAAFGIGSTNFRYAAGTPTDGFRTSVFTEPTAPAELESQVCRAIDRLERASHERIDAVSIAVTGLVDASRGTIVEFDTASGETVTDLHLGARIEETVGLPVAIENDCTASVLGEYVFGAGNEYRCVAHVTLGTGIGGGVVENGNVLRGEHGHASEIGLIPIVANGDLESFGVRGAWEAYCSGRGIPTFVEALLSDETRKTSLRGQKDRTARDLFEAAAAGDDVAMDYRDRIDRLNAAGIGAIANAYNPGLITLGGGVVLNNQEVVLTGIERYLEEYCYVEPPVIKVSSLGDYIGLFGALGLFDDEVVAVPSVA